VRDLSPQEIAELLEHGREVGRHTRHFLATDPAARAKFAPIRAEFGLPPD